MNTFHRLVAFGGLGVVRLRGRETEEEWRISLLSSSGEGLFQVTEVCIAYTTPTWRFTPAVQKGAAANAYF